MEIIETVFAQTVDNGEIVICPIDEVSTAGVARISEQSCGKRFWKLFQRRRELTMLADVRLDRQRRNDCRLNNLLKPEGTEGSLHHGKTCLDPDCGDLKLECCQFYSADPLAGQGW